MFAKRKWYRVVFEVVIFACNGEKLYLFKKVNFSAGHVTTTTTNRLFPQSLKHKSIKYCMSRTEL